MNNSIKVAIAEDHDLVRQGLVALINRELGLKIIFDVGNGQELLDELDEKEVDIVLLDLNMPIMNGQQAMREMRERFPEVKIIVVSMLYDDDFITESIELGARGFLPKNIDFEELVDAIFAVHETGYYFDKRITKALIISIATNKGKRPLDHSKRISEREMAVLVGICEGNTNPQIADKMSVSVRTVESHKRNLLIKTNRTNVVGLVKYAIENGLFKVRVG